MFLKSLAAEGLKCVCMWEKVNTLANTYDKTKHLQQTSFENIVAKGEISLNDQFLLLPQFVQLFSINILSFLEMIPYICNPFPHTNAF